MKTASVSRPAAPRRSEWPPDTEVALVEDTVSALLRAGARSHPDVVALVATTHAGEHRRWTYAELLAAARHSCGSLLSVADPGDHVAIWAPNVAEWPIMQYAPASPCSPRRPSPAPSRWPRCPAPTPPVASSPTSAPPLSAERWCYGQPELSAVTCLGRPSAEGDTTVGPPLPHTGVRIVDPTTGHVRPLGVVGEVRARGHSQMIGYFDDPVGTAAAVDAEGWLRTGDLGAMDEHGMITLAGRRALA